MIAQLITLEPTVVSREGVEGQGEGQGVEQGGREGGWGLQQYCIRSKGPALAPSHSLGGIVGHRWPKKH
jgi:hypothetical protein